MALIKRKQKELWVEVFIALEGIMFLMLLNDLHAKLSLSRGQYFSLQRSQELMCHCVPHHLDRLRLFLLGKSKVF